MKLKLSRDRGVLHLAVRAAVAAHRPQTLRQLLAARGALPFADALAALPPRMADDALSMLGSADRHALERLLPARGAMRQSLGRRIERLLARLPFRGSLHCVGGAR